MRSGDRGGHKTGSFRFLHLANSYVIMPTSTSVYVSRTPTHRGYVHREFWLESLKKGDIFEDLGVDGEIILK